MNMKHSLLNRIVIGKIFGFVVGGLAFFLLPVFGYAIETQFGIGLWLFYIILGVLTAFMGLMSHHPILRFPMPFWFRGAIIGFLMHLMLVLLAYEEMTAIITVLGDIVGIQSPYWILIDGTILGILMGWIETKFGGEGDLPVQ